MSILVKLLTDIILNNNIYTSYVINVQQFYYVKVYLIIDTYKSNIYIIPFSNTNTFCHIIVLLLNVHTNRLHVCN